MALLQAGLCDFGWKAKDFKLKGVDGKSATLADVRGPKGLLVMFICNHCPYVKAIQDRMVRDAKDLMKAGIGVVAINPNHTRNYAEDSFDNMVRVAKDKGYPFPYLHDEAQVVARAYDAVCTPDFFGFDKDLGLQYRGRLDASRREAGPADARRDLYEAMLQIARTGKGPAEQIPSMGCSIEWLEAV